VLEKKGRRQQFFEMWHARFFVVKLGTLEHWRSKEVRVLSNRLN
jgi:hypothetical protein